MTNPEPTEPNPSPGNRDTARVRHRDTSRPVDAAVPSSDVLADIDDEEKVRAIAEQDLRGSRKQTFSGTLLLWLSFQATGVIYGDIGTSPLYVYSSTFSTQPSWDDLVGALSIIIWSLTLIVTVKYCFIVLQADDDGQGGTFALYSLLTRYTHIARRDPKEATGIQMERYCTNDLKAGGKSLRWFLEHSKVSQFILQFIGVLDVSMVMADGVLTPAQSVLGAIQGIKVANPNLGTSAIIGISCSILAILFFVQPLGTSKIGTSFAPIVSVWLLFNLCSGIYNLAVHDYTVLKAFSPHFAFAYLVRNGHEGWRSLGGLLLAFTGVEALFADLGAFSKRAVQVSWLYLAYPSLLLAYIGQAAFISRDETGTAFTNPFFYTVPPGSFYFSLVIAVLLGGSRLLPAGFTLTVKIFTIVVILAPLLTVLAAIVASQAMITSTFQLLTQIMRLSYFPHIKVVHTSKKFSEQVYLPMANWLMMIGTIIVAAVYNNTTSLGNAYGVCFITVTFITTCMVAFVAILVWRYPAYLVFPIWLIFASLDGAFLSSVYEKVPDGAWFTLMLAFILSSIFTLWRFGKEAQWKAESKDLLSPAALLDTSTATSTADLGSTTLAPIFGGVPVSTVPGIGVFFDKSGDSANVPPSFAQFVIKFAARPAVILFFHMRPLSAPSIPLHERYIVTRVSGVSSCYSVVLRHGYTDNVLYPGLARDLLGQIDLAISKGRRTYATDAELKTLRSELNSQMVYVLGKETMKIRSPPRGSRSLWVYFRSLLLGIFLWIRENSRAKLANLDIDADKVIEVGFLKEI